MQANSISSSTSGKPVFKNGNSSGKSTDLQQKKAEAEAEIEAARKKEEERIKRDLAAFQELKAEFSTLRKQLEEANQKAETDRVSNEKNLMEVSKELESSQKYAHGLETDLESTQNELTKVKKEKKDLERDRYNNLDPECHGNQFNIINVYARIALDFGADNGTRCHGWNWDPKNGSQPMRVERVDSSDPNSSWTIRSGGRYLELRDTSGGQHQPMCSGRRSGSEARNQEWLIGYDGYRPGHFWLWNQGQRCYLKLVDGDLYKNGGTFGRVTADNDRWDTRCQFVMVTTVPYQTKD